MSDKFINDIFNSDLDAFKETIGIQTASFTYSGSIGAGQEIDLYTSPLTVTGLDFSQVLFDNSVFHPGRFRNMALENATMVNETTRGSQLQCNITMLVSGNTIKFGGRLFNDYSTPVTLQSTTISFLYIPYQSTL